MTPVGMRAHWPHVGHDALHEAFLFNGFTAACDMPLRQNCEAADTQTLSEANDLHEAWPLHDKNQATQHVRHDAPLSLYMARGMFWTTHALQETPEAADSQAQHMRWTPACGMCGQLRMRLTAHMTHRRKQQAVTSLPVIAACDMPSRKSTANTTPRQALQCRAPHKACAMLHRSVEAHMDCTARRMRQG